MIQTRKTALPGFTIVELLIVIVIIGILAAITIVAYNGIQDRAKQAKMNSDIAEIVKALNAARTSAGKTFSQLNGGSTAAGAACWGKASGTDLSTLPSSDSCWTSYRTALTAIGNASGANLTNLVDPWGRPYLLDENEGENGGCGKDTVAVYKLPFTTGFGVYSTTPGNNVPLSGVISCP